MNVKTLRAALLLMMLWPTLLLAQKAPIVPPIKGESKNFNMFDGKSIDGWQGDGKTWTIEDGELIARGSADGPIETQLVTEVPFSDFRVTIEFKSTAGAKSGVGFWKAAPAPSDAAQSIDGHVVWIAPDHSIARSGRVVFESSEKAKTATKPGDWNQVEILAQGNRVRVALNGEILSDWRDPSPDGIAAGPIAIHFEADAANQDVRFRKLHLETFPAENKLVTLSIDQRIAEVVPGPLHLDVDPKAANLWSKNSRIVLPDELLEPFVDATYGLTTMGIRAEESSAFHAVLEKARLVNLPELRAAAFEFREIRRHAKGNEAYLKREPREFSSFIDLFHHTEDYHGKPVTLRGNIRKLIRIPAADNAYGIREYFETWLYDTSGQNHPAVILSTSIDKDLLKLQGADIEVDHVLATGYFVKNMGYEGQDQFRFAPVFIAQQLELLRPATADPWALTTSAKWVLIAFAVLLAFWARFFVRMRKQARIDDEQREIVREIVERQQPEPSFDHLADVDAVPDFSSYGKSETS